MKNFRGSALAAGVGTPESVPYELLGSSLRFYLVFKHRDYLPKQPTGPIRFHLQPIKFIFISHSGRFGWIMKKVKIDFEFMLDKDKFRLTKSIAQIRVFYGKKEFVIKIYQEELRASMIYLTDSVIVLSAFSCQGEVFSKENASLRLI